MHFSKSLFQNGVPVIVLSICVSCLATLGIRAYFAQQDMKHSIEKSQAPVPVNDVEGESISVYDTAKDK
jgi:hypothetical protein